MLRENASLSDRARRVVRLVGCCVAVIAPAFAGAQEVTLLAGGAAAYHLDPNAVVACENQLTTAYPDPVTFLDASIGTIIGADTFYTRGYTGANTITTNIEGGHVWDGHVTLGHVTSRTNLPGTPISPFVTPAYHSHATATGMIIGGRMGGASQGVHQLGIAPATDLRSGAIATSFTSSGGWTTTPDSMAYPYASSVSGFGTADVINSSWAAGFDSVEILMDSLANQNRFTTFVSSGGNGGGSSTPAVPRPASGYNGISVGALQNDGLNHYDSIASFSSRGPNNYRDPTQTVISTIARRATIDIVAPGTDLFSALYDGQTAGNDPSFPGSQPPHAGSDSYKLFAGTSASSPIVAGGVTLMHQAAAAQIASADAEDTRVIKANLINAARKVSGWSNNQTPHPNGNGGVRTTDALDMVYGGGALDLNRTYHQYLEGQADLPGMAGGSTPQTVGWDYGSVNLGGNTDVVITSQMSGELRVTLSWFRDRTYTDAFTQVDVGFANLNLQVWDSTFTRLISESMSSFNETEHLTFILPEDGLYALRVAYPGNVFGSLTSEEFGLAWYGTAVPEPATALAILPMVAVAMRRRRGGQKSGKISCDGRFAG